MPEKTFATGREIEQKIERYWDARSTDFSNVRRKELFGEDGSLWRELLCAHLPQKNPLRILDVGTGAGFFAILLAKEGHAVTGIDMSKKMLDEARQNIADFGCQVELRKMNAQQLDFPDASFDVVISRNLTWTLPDAMEAYREWHRVLKKGGVLLNFDSDCGEITFSKGESKDDVHAAISKELIEECNEIKDELRISTHRRPSWDVELLTRLGFSVESEPNVAAKVRKDERLVFDSTPLFGLYAQKRS